MDRSKRIKPVAKFAQQQERNAASELGKCRNNLNEQEKKLSELTEYRDEYTRRFAVTNQTSVDARVMQDYRVFLQRLNEAIEMQRGLVNQEQEACNRQTENWLGRRSRANALDKVVQRYQQTDAKKALKQEQREQDEHAARTGQNKNID
ncbi:MAG TPA: flagellar export protein FliJ [Gammaproteobacteria bacterium]|nr:flagellar export protein FliJ [Gammaproteobacteria bacterium]